MQAGADTPPSLLIQRTAHRCRVLLAAGDAAKDARDQVCIDPDRGIARELRVVDGIVVDGPDAIRRIPRTLVDIDRWVHRPGIAQRASNRQPLRRRKNHVPAVVVVSEQVLAAGGRWLVTASVNNRVNALPNPVGLVPHCTPRTSGGGQVPNSLMKSTQPVSRPGGPRGAATRNCSEEAIRHPDCPHRNR